MTHPAPPSAKARLRGAFTLVEVLLALALFAIGFAMVATLPSSAIVIQRRFEQIVEGEIAAANVIQQVGSRKAFWPMYEYQYAGVGYVQLLNGVMPKNAGTSQVNLSAYDGAGTSGRYDSDPTAGGLAIPLVFTPTGNSAPIGNAMSNSRKQGWQLDADTQADFEDWVANIDKFTDNHNLATNRYAVTRTDNGWGTGSGGVRYETRSFLQAFDTNVNADFTTGGNLYTYTSDWGWTAGIAYFSDTGDRTNFLKGSIFHGHNRLLPANLYPQELTSYPTQVPLDKRRIFISLMVSDADMDAANRQWILTAVAHSLGSGDAWPEVATAQQFIDHCGPFGQGPGGLQPLGTSPSPMTVGDLSTRYPAVPGLAMVANAYGMVDTWADQDAPGAYTTLTLGPNSNQGFAHGLLSIRHPNTWGLTWTATVPLVPTPYPTLMSLPALIYDWDKSLLQVAYPHAYVPVAGQSDRRLKVGDHLLTREGGLVLSVKSVRDESRPQYAVADRPFYQIVEVYPPLNQSMLGGPRQSFNPVVSVNPAGPGPFPWPGAAIPTPTVPNTQMSSANTYPYWRLEQIFVAPAPVGKTASSWMWTDAQTNGQFISNNPNH